MTNAIQAKGKGDQLNSEANVSEARLRIRPSSKYTPGNKPIVLAVGNSPVRELAAYLDRDRVSVNCTLSASAAAESVALLACDLLLVHVSAFSQDQAILEVPCKQIVAIGSTHEIDSLLVRYPGLIGLTEGASATVLAASVMRVAELVTRGVPDASGNTEHSATVSPNIQSELLRHLTNEIANVMMSLQPSLSALEDLAQNESLIVEHANAVSQTYHRLEQYVQDINTLVAQPIQVGSVLPLPILEGFIDECIVRASPSATFISRLAPELWPIGIGAADIRTLCQKLLDNAFAATSRGGSVRLDVDNVRLPAVAALDLPVGDYLRIRVTDDGVGMSESTLRVAKEPFFTTWGRNAHWRGLGLTQVDAICRRGKGALHLQSALGRGTVATALLCRLEGSGATSPPSRGCGAVVPISRFLVVDDEPLVLASLHRGLTQLGHTVHLAQDAPTALALLEEGSPFQFAVIDLHLGQTSGFDLAREIRRRHSELHLVLTTGFHSVESSAPPPDGLQQRMDVLHKPFDVGALLSLLSLRQALSTGR